MFVKKTTKYYKEVSGSTTITPKYKCYKVDSGTAYYYYNVLDGTLSYANSPVNNESELGTPLVSVSLVSITETVLTLTTSFGGNFTCTRSTDNDFGSYITTGSTVIPGTPDDYTYKEDVLKHYAITKGDKKYILTHNGKYY